MFLSERLDHIREALGDLLFSLRPLLYDIPRPSVATTARALADLSRSDLIPLLLLCNCTYEAAGHHTFGSRLVADADVPLAY